MGWFLREFNRGRYFFYVGARGELFKGGGGGGSLSRKDVKFIFKGSWLGFHLISLFPAHQCHPQILIRRKFAFFSAGKVTVSSHHGFVSDETGGKPAKRFFLKSVSETDAELWTKKHGKVFFCCCPCLIDSVAVSASDPCKSLATSRNYKLYTVSGVDKPSRSRCQTECSAKTQALAVPTTQLEYQCMIHTAGAGTHGFAKPFWTGLVVYGQDRLSGIVNGTNYTGIGFFGTKAFDGFKRTHFQSIFWSLNFGDLAAATRVYFHNGYYVSADDSFVDLGRFDPDWKQMFCMCQGKQWDQVFRFVSHLSECVLYQRWSAQALGISSSFAGPVFVRRRYSETLTVSDHDVFWYFFTCAFDGFDGHCALPRYTSSNISRTPWAKDLKLSENLNELIFKTKFCFYRRRPPLVTIATFNVDACFWKSKFWQFSCKSSPELDVFLLFLEECPKRSLLWKFGLDIPLDGVLTTIFVSGSFSFFNDLNMAILSPWHQEWCQSIWFL